MNKLIPFLLALVVTPVALAFNGVMSIPDVRVAPLVQTCWGQTSDTGSSNSGQPCFNRYTPKNTPCGCTAAAMAQIMRYWQYPKSAPKGNYVCAIGDAETTLSIWSGDYDWASMPLDTRAGVSSSACEAIGKLTYDCAVAMHTVFGSGASFAFSECAFSVLTGTFDYANAICHCSDRGIAFDAVKSALFASLDIGAPVMASLLTGDETGHQVLIDGYGFNGETPYVHIRFGWPASSDACDCWYVLPNVTPKEEYVFTRLDGIVYNIFPKDSGDVLSGRILDENRKPLSGMTVSASAAGVEAQNVKTDEKGIYAFLLPGGKSYTVTCGKVSKTVKLAKSVSADCNWKDPFWPIFTNGGTCGNSWGNDLIVSQKVDPVPPEEDPEEDPEEEPEEDPLGAFNPIQPINGVYPFCGVVYNEDESVAGTITLKLGKASKKGISSVSGSITTLDGKKYTMKSYKAQVTDKGPCEFNTTAGKLGDVVLRVGSKGFEARVFCKDGMVLRAVPADLTHGFEKPSAVVFSLLDNLPETIAGAEVLGICTPDGEPIQVTKAGKFSGIRKAASPKIKKISYRDENNKKQYRYELQGLDDPKKPNRSGLKLTYTTKSGTFKGSFYVYCNLGTKLKKYTFKVNGVVVDGVGTGLAVCSKPSITLGVSIKTERIQR